MSVNQEQICRLCLKMTKKEFVEIDEVIKQMCDILLLKLDLEIIDSTICLDCVKVAKKCLNFKAICIYAEKTILSFSISKKKVKHNIKVIYQDNKYIVIAEHLDICRFCMTHSERSNFVSLDTLANETAFEMLPEYMPELDCNVIENPMICTTCRESLDDYFKFVLKCLDLERKIKSYCGDMETDSGNQAKLTDSLQFLVKGSLEYSVKSPQIDEFKEELNTSGNTEGVYHEIYSGLMKPEKQQFINEKIYLVENPKEAVSSIKQNNNVKCLQNYTSVHKNVSEIKMYKCSACAYESNRKGNLNVHMLVHKDPSEIRMHKCSFCAYEARHKSNLQKHMLVHSEVKMYKCSFCPYEAEQKGSLKIHLLAHKEASTSTVKLHCPLCTYKAKQTSHLTTHMLVHKDVSEIKMHKCPLCAYEAKQKCHIKRHMLVHSDASEIKMHKCLLCPYKSKHKNCLKTHMLVHRNPSEIEMYDCPLCDTKIKYKRYLKTHMLRHENFIKQKNNVNERILAEKGLQKYMSNRKKFSNFKTYKCSTCTYESKHKSDYNKHMLVHKDTSEITMHKCPLCTYASKQKSPLKTHMLVHKGVSEVNMYKCALCAHKTKYKGSLKLHMLVHKKASEIEMYKCSFCTYAAKQKSSLKTHMLVHKDSSEIKMYKCSSCSYETKLKGNLKKHMLTYKVHKSVA